MVRSKIKAASAKAMNSQIYPVKGMHCASCSAIISKKLKKLPGIESCDVNFATEKATIAYDMEKVSIEDMNQEINKLGYTIIAPQHANHMSVDHSEHLGLNQSKEEKLEELANLESKVAFALPVTIFIFLLMLWDIGSKLFVSIPNLPIPMHLFNTISFLLASIVLFWIGKPYIEAVARFIQYKVANMDSLVGIGTLTAYIYSSIVLLIPQIRDIVALPEYTYFDVTIVVIGFITLGKYLESKSKLRTGEAIEKLLNLQAKTALVLRDKKEIEIPVEEVMVGDIIIIKSGERIPVDGVIVDGKSAVDESMINGEPLPVDKKNGDTVIGATLNKQGSFTYKATKVGADTMLSQIIKLVEQAQGSKSQMQNFADKISSIFIPAVLVIAIIAFIGWLTVGTYFMGFSTAISYSLLAFVGILVIACPCALGLATPTAIIVGVGKGAESGILIKNAESLEKLHKVTTVVLDKTGTITSGKPTVTDIITLDTSISQNRLLQYVYSVESHSKHPLAVAIADKAKTSSISKHTVKSFKEIEGSGVEGIVEGKYILVRKPRNTESTLSELHKLQDQGKTVIIVEIDKKIKGIIAISDSIKTNAREAIKKLHTMGIQTVMLTGDNKRTANFIAQEVGIDIVEAEVLPQDKSRSVKQLQNNGQSVAMVGDGINDSPALMQANVGIAMATGSDIAIESADITLLSGDIYKVTQAISLSRSTVRTIKQNLFWAFIYNIIGIPLAAGVLYPVFGFFLNPIFAGLAMAFSSVSVVGNSLLLKKGKL